MWPQGQYYSHLSVLLVANLLKPDFFWSYRKIAGALGKVKKFEKAAKVVKKADKHLGGAKKVVNRAKQVHKVVSRVHQVTPAHNSGRNNNAQRGRHHRRDLEDDEELLRRDLDAEEVFERQYDDFLDERDFFDDLD